MNREEIEALLARQRAYYKSGATLPVKFRIACLRRLYDAILAHEEEITYGQSIALRDPLELFAEFYEQQNGKEPDGARLALMKELLSGREDVQ